MDARRPLVRTGALKLDGSDCLRRHISISENWDTTGDNIDQGFAPFNCGDKSTVKTKNTSKSFHLRMPMPGAVKEDVEVRVGGSVLLVDAKEAGFDHPVGRYFIQMPIHLCKLEEIRAIMVEDGVLELVFPKKKKKKSEAGPVIERRVAAAEGYLGCKRSCSPGNEFLLEHAAKT